MAPRSRNPPTVRHRAPSPHHCFHTPLSKFAPVRSRLSARNQSQSSPAEPVISRPQLQKLQLVQNAAARLVTGTHRREHITPVLFASHWLPIRQRIQFQLLLLVYRCTHQFAPAYPMDLVVLYVPARSLRSAEQNLLTVKRYNLERYGRRSFSVAGPSLWNALPSAIRNSMSLPAFSSSLQTHIFHEAFVTLL